MGAEGGFEGPRPASDTVEILPLPQPEESEPSLVEARTSWPVEVSAVAIETASLPALAGEPPPSLAGIAAAGENEAPGSGAIETARVDVPHLQPIGEAPDEDAGGAAPPTAESEQGVPLSARRNGCWKP